MSKATGTQSVFDYSNGIADPVSVTNFYDEVIYELGRFPIITAFTTVNVTANTQLYPLSVISLWGMVFGQRWLFEEGLRNLEYLQSGWRDITKDEPWAFVVEGEKKANFRLYPTPTQAGQASSGYGTGYGDGNLVPFYSEYRTNVPAWMELAVTMGALSKEFSRSSDHTDLEAAKLAQTLHETLLAMVS